MSAIRHFDSAGVMVTVTAQVGPNGNVVYRLNGVDNPGPNFQFPFGQADGSIQSLSIRYTGPAGTTCQVTIQHGTQTDFDFLSSVLGAPPDSRDHDFITLASAGDVTSARTFREFQLKGRAPFGRRGARRRKGGGQ